MALNGRFPDSLLAYLGWPEADHLRLVPAAAASITRLAAAFEAAFGKPLYLSDAYRTYAVQVTLKVIKGKFAATPGTSNHGLGLAVDAASRVNVDGSAEHRWMEMHAPAYGWVNPTWAVDWISANGQHEPWHWEYKSALDTPATPTAPLSEEDDDMISLIERTYRDLCDRTASLDEVAGWYDSTRGWTAARFLAAFRANKAEGGTVRAAYRKILRREAGASEVTSQLAQNYTISEMFDVVARAHAAGSR